MEEAWGQGTRFVERRSWAMYFTYTVEEPIQCGGDGSKCVFVTSKGDGGNLGGLPGADAICQARAEAGGSLAAPGTYKAWLSDETTSPSTRFTQASVPYKLVDGTTIATDWADLTDGNLDAPIALTELGGAPLIIAPWTGTTAEGLATVQNCQGWSTEAPDSAGLHGNSQRTDEQWSDSGLTSCGGARPFYCFQQ